MKILLLLALTLYSSNAFGILSDSGVFVYEGQVTLKNGIYESILGSELVLKVSAGEVELCGRNLFEGNRVGKIGRKWQRWGKYLHQGRVREGTFEDQRLQVEREYQSSNGKQIQRITLVQKDEGFIYSFKDSQVGGFEVEGKKLDRPNPDLQKLCL